MERFRDRDRGRQGNNNDYDDVTPKTYCAYQRDIVGSLLDAPWIGQEISA